jgi:hypothetical protein
VSDTTAPNYPDLLGAITGGHRHTIGVMQVALAVRPRVVRAGRPFEVIMLIQNAADVDVDVTVTLHIPDRDAGKKKGRFVAKVDRLVIGLKPAEVGYVVLPVSCLPDTTVGADYKVGMDIAVKTLDKPRRIRQNDGGGPVDLSSLKEEVAAKLQELKQLPFAASKKSGLRASGLETAFSVMSGRVGAITDLQPGWTSLWTMEDHDDDRVLLQRYYETLKVKVLPALTRTAIYAPLLEETTRRFEAAGYPLKRIEALFITKLLALVVEHSSGEQNAYNLGAGIYNIVPLLSAERVVDPAPLVLPKWVSALLRAIARDERAAHHPALAITRLGYKDLLTDAIQHAFEMIETATGEDLGGPDEMQEYGKQVLRMLDEPAELDFTHTYMPLVLGGIIVYDRVMLEDEQLGELLQDMSVISDERKSEMTDDNEPIFRMSRRLINQALMKYGHRN